MTAPARVLLIGMMGAGKSSVGEAIACRTGWRYIDNDELVRSVAGRPTPEVLREGGEQALRVAEANALRRALEIPEPVIAGVAGGVVEDDSDRTALRDGAFVVWLRARVETLAQRVGSGEGRPWLQPDPEAALRHLYAGRAPLYEEVASLVVDVDEATPDELADQVITALDAR
jgi:shikimate kinase